jgi:hypothetical protein
VRAEDLLAVYDQQFAELGASVIAARQLFLEQIGGELGAAFSAITRTRLSGVRPPCRLPDMARSARPRTGSAGER